MRLVPWIVASPLLLLATGCGYHTLGSAAHIPEDVHTIAVPFFSEPHAVFAYGGRADRGDGA